MTREPIEIEPTVREDLRTLLIEEYEGTGIGYSAFILAAIGMAYGEQAEKFKERAINAQQAIALRDRRARRAS